jgi:hypothetical protein
MRVLRCFLDRGQAGAGAWCLPLSRDSDLSILSVVFQATVLSLALDFLLQNVQIKTSQRIGTEAAALVALLIGNGGVVLQQIGDSAEDGRAYAMGVEGLEQ